MTTRRPGRVQEAIRQEIAKIVQFEMKDPRLGFITITKVELTKDLRYARVYFSVLGAEREKHLTLKGLNSAKGYIRGLISDRVKLRFTPEISFLVDESMEHTKLIHDILEKLKREKEKNDEKSDRGDKGT